MSEVKVNKISPRSGTDVTLGDSSDTFTVPSGVGLTLTASTLLLPTTIQTDKLDPKSGTDLEIGSSGDTITIPSGATITNSGTATGFGGGKIGQVFSHCMTGKFTMTSTTATVITDGATSFSQAITPVATSSKILLMANVLGSGGTDASPSFIFDRDGSGIAVATGGATNRELGTGTYGYQTEVGGEEITTCSMMFLDAPSTTSATTYEVHMWNADSDGVPIYVNRTVSNSASPSYTDPVSTFTIMEILA